MREEFVLPPPVPADSPFQLRLAGVSYCDGSYRIERETADFSVVEYVERGTGTLEIDGEEFHPSAGDLYFLPEGSRHRYWSDAHNPWVKYWMNFGGVLGTELRRIFRVERLFLVRGFSRPELFLDALHQFRKHPEFIHTRTGPEFLTAVITTMAADLAGAAGKPAISEEGELLRARLDAAVFGTVPSLEELAVAISKSCAQTIRIFRRDFGETPLQYLLDRKMEAARELLASTRTPIKELAAMLGFTDPYHFAALFRRRNGLPPGRYRTVSANSGTGRPTGADRTPPDRSA